jgi:hypothetical protein
MDQENIRKNTEKVNEWSGFDIRSTVTAISESKCQIQSSASNIS